MAKALRVRKLFGGAMRQAGFLAAAAIYALDNNVERLAEDHQKAKRNWSNFRILFLCKKSRTDRNQYCYFLCE